MSIEIFTASEFVKLDRNLLYFHVFGRTLDGKIAIRTLAPTQAAALQQFFTESGAPAALLGNIGDMYLDEDSLELYGPKNAGGWGTSVSLGGGKILIETTTTGTDSYTVAGVIGLEDKLMIPFMSDVYNIGPATLDYMGLGPKAIVDVDGNQLCNLDIKPNRLVFTKYDAANDNFILLNPSIETFKTFDSLVINYAIINGVNDRDFDATLTSVDELMDLIHTLVFDIYESGLFAVGATNCMATSVVKTWITNNVSGVRGFDANLTTLDELSDVFGTLITDLKTANFFNGSPLQESNQTYTITNSSIDRAGDANLTIVDELADILATIILDLKSVGIIS